MKKIISISFTVYSLILNVYAQQSANVDLVFDWQSADTNVKGYNDIWGFEKDGKEYAVIGSNWGTHFLEVSQNLPQILEIANFEGKANNVTWRDYKTYSHYVYGVADGDSNSLQIFDFQYLPDSIVKVLDTNLYTESAHNIYIENDRLYFASNKIEDNNSDHALDIYSLQNPEEPTLLAAFSNNYFDLNLVHDVQVVGNIAYCSSGYGGLHIYDFEDVNNPVLKAKIDIYPEQGYNHSSWLSDDGSKLVVADEVPASLALKLFQVSDYENIELLDIFYSSDSATPHNPFFVDDKIIVSYYLDGVQIFDYSNVFDVNRVGFYDTYPQNSNYNNNHYGGCWGVYPYLPSKNILASDRTNGLFVLKNELPALNVNKVEKIEASIHPNPIKNNKINLKSKHIIEQFWIFNSAGKIVKTSSIDKKSNKIIIDNVDFESGNYLISILLSNGKYETLKFKI